MPHVKKLTLSIALVLLIALSPVGIVHADGESTILYKSQVNVNSTTTTLTSTAFSVNEKDTVLLFYYGNAVQSTIPNAPTDSNGCNYTQVRVQGTASTDTFAVAWICASEPATNASVTVGLSGIQSTTKSNQLFVRVYSGVDNANPIDVYNSNTSSAVAHNSNTALSVTTTRANDMVVVTSRLNTNAGTSPTAGSGINDFLTVQNTFSSSKVNSCDGNKYQVSAGSTGSITVCNYASPGGTPTDTSFTIALRNGSCATGYTGTYPSCAPPSSGGGGTTVVSGSDLDIHYVHQLAVKGFALAVAVFTAIAFIYPFRWRGHRD